MGGDLVTKGSFKKLNHAFRLASGLGVIGREIEIRGRRNPPLLGHN